MKKTSKRKKFAKILATFLGTSATLIPIAALVSCEQTAKTPVVKEEKKQKPQDPPPPNPQNPKTPGNGGGNNNNEQFIPDNEQNIDGVQIGSIKDKEKNIIGKEIKGTLNIDSIKKLIDDLNERQITDIKSDEFKITCKNELFSKNLLEKLAKALSVTKIENITNNGIQNIELDKNATIKTIDGNIALKDIIDSKNQETTKIVDYIIQDLKNKNTDFDSSKLKINTFYKKPKAISTTTSISRNIVTYNNGTEFEYTSTDITPEVFEENDGFTKTSLNYKDEKGNIYIKLNGTFDITELYNKVKNNNKLYGILNDNTVTANDIKGSIILQGERIYKKEGFWDITPYATVDELLELVRKDSKLKNIITVDSVQLRGNVKELLPYLANKEIKEINDGIVFNSSKAINCNDIRSWVGFEGKDNKNQTSILKINELIEFKNRTKNPGAVYIKNAVIQPEDFNSINKKQLKGIEFNSDSLENVTFKNCDLSKIEMNFIYAGNGTLKFEESTLPISMNNTVIGNLILKNSELPQELKNEKLSKMSRKVPVIENSLKIFNLKLLDKWTKEKIKEFKVYEFAPPKYVGPQAVWDKLRWLYDEKIGRDDLTPVKVHFTNEDLTDTPEENINFTDENLISSINKNKDQYLALLKQRNDKVHA